MIRKALVVALVLVVGATMAGCVTESGYYSPGQSAGAGVLGGAATGAAVGAIIGAATGAPATGAWVGAAAGGLLGGVGGYLYAEHRNSEISSARAAAQNYNYNPSQGNMVSIDNVSANPATVAPGQQVNLAMTYTILSPSNAPTSVSLVREVRYRGNLLGQPYQTQVTNANGTFSDSVAYTLPNNAAPGSYTVTERVMSSYGSASRDTYFNVQ
jgi:predicted small secreted protein